MLIGIDLGTTNSLIGVFRDGKPELFPNPTGKLLTPSAVSIDADDNVIVGEAAKERLVTQPAQSVAAFKRWMGTERETTIGSKKFRAEELSSLVIRNLVADAEAATSEKVTEAVISVPAYFSDAQRKATRLAGEMAGIKVERLINEPTAAALAYGLQDRMDGGRFLVFDLGGGTLDVSIIEIFEGVVEVHASAGDNYLGGEDFLKKIVEEVCSDQGIPMSSLEPGELAQLRRRCDTLKHSLTSKSEAGLEMTLAGKDIDWSITESKFEELCKPLIQRLAAPLERSLRDASLSPNELDEVILVGGASRMPLVARTVTRLLGKLPLRHINPDEAIASGAVVACALKARDSNLEEVILTDVAPYTLGTDVIRRDSSGNVHDGYMLPIIPRNSTIPVSREEELFPYFDEQDTITCTVFQGEHPIAENNIALGQLTVDLPKGKTPEERGIYLRYTYDINGLLEVTTKVKATGEQQTLVLEQTPGLLSKEEIKERLTALEHLKIHPRDQQENLALIARAERLYEEHLHERDAIQQMLMDFKGVLRGQNNRDIERARGEMLKIMDALESS